MLLFDSHCHLGEDDDPASLYQEGMAAGVGGFVLAGTTPEDSAHYARVASGLEGVFSTVGIHPHTAERHGDDLLWMSSVLEQHPSQVVAVGEIGLDYYYDHSPRARQRDVFSACLDFAAKRELPAVVHCRDAYDECLEVLADASAALPPLLIHSFTGSAEWAEQVLAMGAHFSFNGIVTFKNASNVRDALRVVPLNRLLLETDAPYLAPSPHRGKRNRPAWVAHVARRVAEELDRPYEEVARQTTANAAGFFGLPDSALEGGRRSDTVQAGT